jgi:thiol-disulfide isomerase/thioredoxin
MKNLNYIILKTKQSLKQSLKIWLITVSLISFFSPLTAEVINLSSGQEISQQTLGDDNAEFTLLWLHSERGVVPNLKDTLTKVAQQKSVKIILPDFHDSYFIPVTRSSLDKIPQKDLEEFINKVAQNTKPKKLFILAMSRAAGPALKAAYSLQLKQKNSIAGIILLAPYLQIQTPEIGKKAQYLAIASKSNLPLYLIQAERSPRFIPLPHLIKQLEKGGSPLFTHIIKDVHGGFQQRDYADLRDKDLQALKNFPNTINNALVLLKNTQAAPFDNTNKLTEKATVKKSAPGLQAINMGVPTLQLKDLNGRSHQLSDYLGKTVIVSFWASWCRPCLEEMPSLVKLKQNNKDKLEILAINIRENKETILHFTKAMNINFPILQDNDSTTVKDWKVYVYPSNFIINKKGELRFAATGAMDWQDQNITNLINKLITE